MRIKPNIYDKIADARARRERVATGDVRKDAPRIPAASGAEIAVARETAPVRVPSGESMAAGNSPRRRRRIAVCAALVFAGVAVAPQGAERAALPDEAVMRAAPATLSVGPELARIAPAQAARARTGAPDRAVPAGLAPERLGEAGADRPYAARTTVPAVPVTSTDVAVAGGASVRLNVPSALTADEIAAIEARIEQEGFSASTASVDIDISSSNVRFYHAQDAETAAQIAGRIGAEARDFSWYVPRPDPGLIEVWVKGDALSGPKPAKQTASASGSVTQISAGEPRETGTEGATAVHPVLEATQGLSREVRRLVGSGGSSPLSGPAPASAGGSVTDSLLN